MNNQEKSIHILKKHDLFSQLNERELRYLAQNSLIRQFKKRAYLFHENEEGDYAYIVSSGKVQLFRQADDGREIVIKTVGENELFAEVILFEKDHYPVTAICLTRTEVLLISRVIFRQFLNEEKFRNHFISILMKRQRYLTKRVTFLTLYDLEERFFSFLEEHYGRKLLFQPGVSRKDIAAAIGTTPESLSRLLGRLNERNVLKWKGNQIWINPDFAPWSEKSGD